ncbi:MAG: glucosaminidase domain-containing protein [Bacteroidetes bacterium]|nr:glucosaminidase domain-containing protein [Bacteroidota bacterium]
MKKLLIALVFVMVLVATAANLNLRVFTPPADTVKPKTDTVIVRNDSLFYDSLALSLKKIPRAQHLYTVAKHSVGRWAKLFTVVKIEESGADGQNSFFARNYNNLTGMRYPGTARQTTSTGSGMAYYAIFSNWHDCMVDFRYYMQVIDNKFVARYGREPKDEYEMVNFMFGSFNVHQKWKNDMYWLLNHFHYK